MAFKQPCLGLSGPAGYGYASANGNGNGHSNGNNGDGNNNGIGGNGNENYNGYGSGNSNGNDNTHVNSNGNDNSNGTSNCNSNSNSLDPDADPDADPSSPTPTPTTARIPVLPPEILDQIALHVPQRSLTSFVCANSLFYSVAMPHLYSHLRLTDMGMDKDHWRVPEGAIRRLGHGEDRARTLRRLYGRTRRLDVTVHQLASVPHALHSLEPHKQEKINFSLPSLRVLRIILVRLQSEARFTTDLTLEEQAWGGYLRDMCTSTQVPSDSGAQVSTFLPSSSSYSTSLSDSPASTSTYSSASSTTVPTLSQATAPTHTIIRGLTPSFPRLPPHLAWTLSSPNLTFVLSPESSSFDCHGPLPYLLSDLWGARRATLVFYHPQGPRRWARDVCLHVHDGIADIPMPSLFAHLGSSFARRFPPGRGWGWGDADVGGDHGDLDRDHDALDQDGDGNENGNRYDEEDAPSDTSDTSDASDESYNERLPHPPQTLYGDVGARNGSPGGFRSGPRNAFHFTSTGETGPIPTPPREPRVRSSALPRPKRKPTLLTIVNAGDIVFPSTESWSYHRREAVARSFVHSSAKRIWSVEHGRIGPLDAALVDRCVRWVSMPEWIAEGEAWREVFAPEEVARWV